MGEDQISDGFDSAATGEQVAAILLKPTVNITDVALADMTQQIKAVTDGNASAEDIASLTNALTTLADACCVFNPNDKEIVRGYIEDLGM